MCILDFRTNQIGAKGGQQQVRNVRRCKRFVQNCQDTKLQNVIHPPEGDTRHPSSIMKGHFCVAVGLKIKQLPAMATRLAWTYQKSISKSKSIIIM